MALCEGSGKTQAVLPASWYALYVMLDQPSPPDRYNRFCRIPEFESTCSLCVGLVVPMPTLPLSMSTVTLGVVLPLLSRALTATRDSAPCGGRPTAASSVV